MTIDWTVPAELESYIDHEAWTEYKTVLKNTLIPESKYEDVRIEIYYGLTNDCILSTKAKMWLINDFVDSFGDGDFEPRNGYAWSDFEFSLF